MDHRPLSGQDRQPSGIVNDPNDWSREFGDPRYVVDLLARIVIVSLQTNQIVDNLPILQYGKTGTPSRAHRT